MSYKFLDLVEAKKLPTPVDCGSCPVSLACAVGEGSTGYTFNCCHSTAVEYGAEVSEEGIRTLLIIDCQNHGFEQNEYASECVSCPMCTGAVMETAHRELTDRHRYVPTVHAKFSVGDRVRVWRKALAAARVAVAAERELIMMGPA